MNCYYNVVVTNVLTGCGTEITRSNREPYVSFKSAMGAAMEAIHISSVLDRAGATYRIDVTERAEDDRGMRVFSFDIVPSKVEGY